MRVIAMISGGKDSCYNMMQCVREGHEIVALANLYPDGYDELDSYMYQTVGHMGIEILAQAIDLPLYRKKIKGTSYQTGKHYTPFEKDEVEDLFSLLERAKHELDIEAVSVGAILSDYQRVRVENVCSRLNLVPLAYLWRRDQSELLQEMIDCNVHAIIIKVAALGLIPEKHLGKSLKEIHSHLIKIQDKYSINICGEGGEYETFTLDCTLFKQKIIVEDMETIITSSNSVCPVGYLNFKKLSLHPKNHMSEYAPIVKSSLDYLNDLYESESYSDLQEIKLKTIEEDKFSKQKLNDQLELLKNERKIYLIQNQPSFAGNKGWIWFTGIQGCAYDISDGFANAIKILKSLIDQSGCNVQDVCYITLYINSMKEFEIINQIYNKFFSFINPPARVCVECPLPENCKVIIEAIAYKSFNEKENYNNRQIMHVQGISHWAPASIGPYSQSIKIGEITYISGQIGLIPGKMKLIEGGIRPQCKLSLRHIIRIANAMNNVQGQLKDVVHGICYVTHSNFISEARYQWEKITSNAVMDYVVVSALPRNALVEWQVWTHSHNKTFEFEKAECSIDDYTVSILRRWNYNSNCAAIVCHVSTDMKKSSLSTSMTQLDQSTAEIHQQFHPNIEDFNMKTLEQILFYVLTKILGEKKDETDRIKLPVVHFRIFYPITAYSLTSALSEVLNNFKSNVKEIALLAYSVVPVYCLQDFHTILSICGVRHE